LTKCQDMIQEICCGDQAHCVLLRPQVDCFGIDD
jgi:hypothetical protein